MAFDDKKDPNKPNTLKEINIAGPNRRPRRKNAHPGRVNLVPQEFEHLIEDQGVLVRVTPTVLCPNRTSLEDTNHVLDCPICFGDEVVELNDQAVEEWGFIQGIKFNQNFNPEGIFDIKDAMITMKQKIRLSYMYKIEVLDHASVYNQLIERGTGDEDATRYNPALKTDIPFNLIDSENKRYVVNKDYVLQDRKIKWKTNRPVSGKIYSIIYPVLPTFRVLEMMHETRFYYIDFKHEEKTPVQLPQQAIIRWDYIARKSGSEVPAP